MVRLFLSGGPPPSATPVGVSVGEAHGPVPAIGYPPRKVDLSPGASATGTTRLLTATCGDSSTDPEVPLPAGSYRAVHSVFVEDVEVEGRPELQPREDRRWWVTSRPFTLS